MFTTAAIALVLLIAILAAICGPRVGLCAGWCLALLVPFWVVLPVYVFKLNFVTIAGLAIVACFVTTPLSKTFGRWLFCDTLMALLVALQLATLLATDKMRVTSSCYIFAEWLLPYLVGRIAIANRDDLDRLTKWLAVPIVIITCLTVVECFLHVSIVDSALGRHWVDQRRYGLSRAFGPTTHPIYLGMFMSLLLPWAIWATYLARHDKAPRWFLALPLICAVGVFTAVSRGPNVVLLGTLSCVAYFHFYSHRTAIACGAVALALFITIGSDMVVEGFRSLEGPSENSQVKMVVVDGVSVEYDGTLHRFLLFRVYDDAMWEGGLLGHGPLDNQSYLSLVDGPVSDVMYSIDNHYVIYTLDHGFLGIGTFVVIAICGLYYTVQAARDSTRPTHIFSAAQFGSLAMVALLMFTVWFAADFRCLWFFSLGCAVAWRAHRAAEGAERRESRPAQVRNVPIRRLVPGHPVAPLAAE